jgi:hypothetical protein
MTFYPITTQPPRGRERLLSSLFWWERLPSVFPPHVGRLPSFFSLPLWERLGRGKLCNNVLKYFTFRKGTNGRNKAR